MNRSKERGQALTEYALLVVVLSIALFAPIFPQPEGAGRISTFGLLISAFDVYVASFHTVISMPVP